MVSLLLTTGRGHFAGSESRIKSQCMTAISARREEIREKTWQGGRHPLSARRIDERCSRSRIWRILASSWICDNLWNSREHLHQPSAWYDDQWGCRVHDSTSSRTRRRSYKLRICGTLRHCRRRPSECASPSECSTMYAYFSCWFS